MAETRPLYGLLAEFASPEALLDAVSRCRAEAYSRLEAYSPFAVDGLAEALGVRGNRVPLAALVGGLLGGSGGYFMQWYSAVIDYPINAGGRPLHSWPSFIPAVFELTVLGAALAAFLAFLLLNGLPRLNHPIFNAPDFDLASRNRFFLCVRADMPGFDADRVHAFLARMGPVRVVAAEHEPRTLVTPPDSEERAA